MPISAKVLTFTANTGTGNQDLTGTLFKPKCAIVWYTRGNNAADTFVEGMSLGFGFTDGTNSRSLCNVSDDAAATSDCARIARNDAIMTVLSIAGTPGTTDGVASFVSFLSNGMRINWSDAPAGAFKFHVLFLGGDDLTDVLVGDIPVSANATTSYVTGFQPDMILGANGHALTASINTAATTGTSFYLGAWGPTPNFRGGAGFVSEGARATMDTWQDSNIGSSSNLELTATTGATANISTMISFNPDGFTLTHSSFAFAATKFYLALKGGSYAFTSQVEPAGTGNMTVLSQFTIPSQCKAVMIWGIRTATSGSVQGNNGFSLGAASLDDNSVITQAVVAEGDTTAQADSVTTTRYETDSVYLSITPAATATSSTVDDEATVSEFIQGGIQLNWTNVGSGFRFFYMLIGDATPPPHSYGKIHSHFDNNQGPAIFG